MRFKQFLLSEEPGRVHRVAPGTITKKLDNFGMGMKIPKDAPREPTMKRGAPEQKARAFDKKGIDRSVLKKLNDKSGIFYVIQGEAEYHDWSDDANDELARFSNYLQIHVVGAISSEAFDKGTYSGITVTLPLKDTKFELDPDTAADLQAGTGADKQVRDYEHSIVKAAIDALKKNDVPDIYDGLGGVSRKVAKVGGISEWESKQLSKLKNKKQD